MESSLSDQRETANLHAFWFQPVDLQLPPGLGFSLQIPSIVGPFSVFDARATASQTVFDFSNIRKSSGSQGRMSKPPSPDFDAAQELVC